MKTRGLETNGNLREKLVEEIADLRAALRFFEEKNMTIEESAAVIKRCAEKLALFEKWHEGPPECPDCGAWHVSPGSCPHLVTLANMALKKDDLTGHDVVEALNAHGYRDVVAEARGPLKDKCNVCGNSEALHWLSTPPADHGFEPFKPFKR